MPAHPHQYYDASLPASRTRTVHLQAVGTDLEAGVDRRKVLQVYGTVFELGNIPAPFTDEVMMMVLGELVARAAAEIQPPHEPQAQKEIQSPVHRDHPDLRTTCPYTFQTLVLLGRYSLQNGQSLRRSLVPATSYLSSRHIEAHIQPLALIEIFFHLQGSRGIMAGQYQGQQVIRWCCHVLRKSL